MSETLKDKVLKCIRDKALEVTVEKDLPMSILECPVCGFNYTHTYGPIEVFKGNDNNDASQIVRGDVIAIPMRCEDGCKFVLCMGFHKGHHMIFGISDGHHRGEPPS